VNDPIIMGDLVAEMAEQGAVGLAHLVASSFALGVVGLREIYCDQPVLMSGQHRRRGIGNKIEGEAVRILHSGGERQFQLQECIEKPMLCGLHHAPMDLIVALAQVGDGAVVPARRAELISALGWDHPIADPVHRIRAKAIA
jgi:hypothetical protein